LIANQISQPVEIFSLDGLQVACGTMGMPTATVRLRDMHGEQYVRAAVGTGPVDATFSAIDQIVNMPVTLLEYSVNAITEGIDAIGEVSVRLQADEGDIPQRKLPQNNHFQTRTFGGHGMDTDIIVASAKAYLSALNKLLIARKRYSKSDSPVETSVVQEG
jgi:2-isopropylmalate synthase